MSSEPRGGLVRGGSHLSCSYLPSGRGSVISKRPRSAAFADSLTGMSHVAPLNLLSAVVVLDSSLDGWNLLDPSDAGSRIFRQPVSFVRAFSVPPIVQAAIVGLDVNKEDNLRIRVRVADITETGFTLQAETWLNTRIWSVDVSWMAIGS